jgi:hypothetical protein
MAKLENVECVRDSKGFSYIDNELLYKIKQFCEENRRVPTQDDFKNNEKYPNFGTYYLHFGGWVNALRMSGIEINDETYKNTLNRKSKGGKKNAIKMSLSKYWEK